MRVVLCAAVLLGSVSCVSGPGTRSSAADSEAEVLEVAETYLKAVSGTGNEAGLELLLGGVTANARLFALENWRIVRKAAPRHEEADLTLAAQLVGELDAASQQAMSGLMGASDAGEAVTVEQLTPEVAAQLMGPTQASADRLLASFPLLSLVLRVGKGVYWSPKNPGRTLLSSAGSGGYLLDLHTFEIETKEGPRQALRQWPLVLLRFKSAQLDTGWKVLPASDWDPE